MIARFGLGIFWTAVLLLAARLGIPVWGELLLLIPAVVTVDRLVTKQADEAWLPPSRRQSARRGSHDAA